MRSFKVPPCPSDGYADTGTLGGEDGYGGDRMLVMTWVESFVALAWVAEAW